MSTFLTQTSSYPTKSNATTTSSLNPQKAQESNQQMHNQLLYAPFVKPTDKVKRDVTDLSFADFQPKRFALQYEPPVIVLEYLVPSTGKLYHHKMKLRQLQPESDTNEMLEYLKKRHPLYFTTGKINAKQITDLINRLKFRMKQNSETTKAKSSSSNASSSLTNKDSFKKDGPATLNKDQQKVGTKIGSGSGFGSQEQEKPKTASQFPSFKTGSQLPSISDNSNAKPWNKENQTKNQFADINKQFAALDVDQYDDDFDEDGDEKNEDGEEEDEDFDANELLNLTDYVNKRKSQNGSNLNLNAQQNNNKGSAVSNYNNNFSSKQNANSNKNKRNFDYDEEEEEDGEDGINEDDGWGDDWGAPPKKDNLKDLENFDYENTNLNKLSDEQLKRHKAKMEEGFQKNALKPGDPGFKYDMRVDFSKQKKVDDGWDDEEDEDNDQYFDDDFS